MRRLFIVFCYLLVAFYSSATNYYFSTSTGNDARTSIQAQNPATPWKTLNKLNQFFNSLAAGDSVRFKRGEVFNGFLSISKSGAPGLPITLSAYGTGSKPVISGLQALSTWAPVARNIYETTLNSGPSVNMVSINGIAQVMGRYPNINSANGGFLTIDSHNGITSITDAALPGSPNWRGAEVVIRKVEWVLDRGLITNHKKNTITYVSPTGHQPVDGNGYFIQNSSSTLDSQGEWYYDAVRKKLRIYSTTIPSLLVVRASVNDTLMNLNNRSYITCDNLSFEGGDIAAVNIKSSNNIVIQYCDINLSGTNGISTEDDKLAGTISSYLTFQYNQVTNSTNSGIRIPRSSHCIIKSNTVRNSGLLPGMGQSNNQQMVGIFAGDGATKMTIDSNIVRNSGYCGITFTGDSALVRYNVVDSFCLTVNDGGGIYTWGGRTEVGRKIIQNIVLNGMGQPYGTTSLVAGGAIGIYMDDLSTNIEVQNNTIANNSRLGIFIHNGHEITMAGNTIYNNVNQVGFINDNLGPDDPIRNIACNNNIIFSKLTKQCILENGSLTNDISQFGSFNNNCYARPLDKNGIITVYYNNVGGGTSYAYYDVPGWTLQYGYDLNSQTCPIEIAPYIVNSLSGSNLCSNGSFGSNINGVNCFGASNCTVQWMASGFLDGGSLKISSGPLTTNRQYIYFNLGNMNANTNYLVKFSTLGTVNGKTLNAYIRNSSFVTVSPVKFLNLKNTRTENEFLFSSTSSISGGYLVLELVEQDGPVHVDNIVVQAANATITNPDTRILFEYNSSSVPKNIVLNGNYVDARNNRYTGNITINAFSSAVLIKEN